MARGDADTAELGIHTEVDHYLMPGMKTEPMIPVTGMTYEEAEKALMRTPKRARSTRRNLLLVRM